METTILRSLSIIGTAGRRDDAARLNRACYDRMAGVAKATVARLGVVDVVSGGAAWADHVAVRMVIDGVIAAERLTLHLPAPFVGRAFDTTTRDGSTANYYHRGFSANAGLDSLDEIAGVIAQGAKTTVSKGFFARNGLVAAQDALLAFTFGGGQAWSLVAGGPTTTSQAAGLKDGGTADTWNRSRAAVKLHVSLG